METQLDFVEFVVTVQSGSFSKAAAILGVSKSHVSKQVSSLERRLDAQLLVRSTRKFVLTDIGEDYFQRCERILEEVREAESLVSEIKGEPEGVLNISLPNIFGELYIVPIIAKFMAQHANLRVNASMSTRNVDLLEEGFDLAIRNGDVTEAGLVARQLGIIHWKISATPGFLKKFGTPESPNELYKFSCVVFDRQGVHDQTFWRLSDKDTTESFPINSIYSTNNAASLINCALQDVGLLFVPELFIREHLQAGELIPVLEGWGLQSTISAVYPYSRQLSIKVRGFVDFLIANIEL